MAKKNPGAKYNGSTNRAGARRGSRQKLNDPGTSYFDQVTDTGKRLATGLAGGPGSQGAHYPPGTSDKMPQARVNKNPEKPPAFSGLSDDPRAKDPLIKIKRRGPYGSPRT
jgi:hypothetical protein